MDEIITGAGPGAVFGAHVRGWNSDGGRTVTPLPNFSFFAWPDTTCRYGATISSSIDLTLDGRDELLVGPGPDPAMESSVKLYGYDGSSITELHVFRPYPAGWTHGANTAAGRFRDP
jgi:hypothetical protein